MRNRKMKNWSKFISTEWGDHFFRNLEVMTRRENMKVAIRPMDSGSKDRVIEKLKNRKLYDHMSSLKFRCDVAMLFQFKS